MELQRLRLVLGMILKRSRWALALALVLSPPVRCVAQKSAGPLAGTVIADGGGFTSPVRQRFIQEAGGPAGARIVAIPTAASSVKFGPEGTILDLNAPATDPEWKAYERYLKGLLGVEHLTILHTRDRREANSPDFVKPLESATGIFLGTGNAGRLADAYLGTLVQDKLAAALGRGAVVCGSSAGSIILGSFTIRGWTEKPLLIAPGHDVGFGFLRNVAINPHLTEAKRDYELMNVVDARPELLGIGIDESAAILVRGNDLQVVGTGRVAIYDNRKHKDLWYYWLDPGSHFDLATWQVTK